MKDEELIYGIRALMEALQAGRHLDRVFLQQGSKGPLFQELEQLLKKSGIRIRYVPRERIDKLTRENHQGAVGYLSPIRYLGYQELIDSVAGSDKPPLFLLLDGVSDVRNLGAIIRTAECAGADGLILPQQGTAPINSDTVKTSAGAVFNLPIAQTPHLKDAVYYLQASGISVVAATEKAEETVFRTQLSGPVALLMGSEGSGISPALLKLADVRAKLPMMGAIGSLNVSVACGIFLFEAIRQRREKA